jgi:hypothetical protein
MAEANTRTQELGAALASRIDEFARDYRRTHTGCEYFIYIQKTDDGNDHAVWHKAATILETKLGYGEVNFYFGVTPLTGLTVWYSDS